MKYVCVEIRYLKTVQLKVYTKFSLTFLIFSLSFCLLSLLIKLHVLVYFLNTDSISYTSKTEVQNNSKFDKSFFYIFRL